MKKRLVIAIIAVVCITLLFTASRKEEYESLKPLMEVYSIIENSYVDEDKVVPEDLIEAAIKGMVSHIDPFSQYLDPQAYKDMNEDTKGEFGGLGIEISVKDGQLTVVSPIEDTPAYEAGIKAGDKIMAIEGDSTEGIDIMDAVHKLRGKPGTKVTISVKRKHEPDWRDITITRAIIKIKTARFYAMGDVGYIRINEFMGDAEEVCRKALKDFKNKNVDKLIIDLRNNPGGLLDQSVKISDLFLPKGDVIVTTVGRVKEKGLSFKSEIDPLFKGDIVVLINKGSASASEILSGALRDNNRAILIGTKTFGKGSVQTIIPLSDKSALRLTTAQYLTPSGAKIHGVGIDPDIELEEPYPSSYIIGLSDKEYFEQFAEEYLKSHPNGIERKPGKEKEKSVKVSESDIKMLFRKTADDKLMDEFTKFLKRKKETIQMQELAQDRDIVLKWLKQEIAKQHVGRRAARKASIENDIQVKRAINILNTMARLKKNK